MPTYEYKCLECGHRFDVFQGMTEDPVAKCESCSGAVKRLIGRGAGIIFKGSGFYETDYKRNRVVSGGESATGQLGGDSGPAAAKPSTPAEPVAGSKK